MHTRVEEGDDAPRERARLAAVVFTDVVGYSAAMQRDEAATIAGVERDFARMREACVQQGGEVLNTMGDGMMLCFGSAVDAVKFALQIQEEFGQRNAAEGGRGLEHRVGIHLGDVFRVAGGHVAGDGVNIAARLESKAPVGGVCVSQTVYDTVKGKVAMRADFAGPQSFKNIAEPINVWHLSPERAAGPAPLMKLKPAPPAAIAGSRRRLIAGVSALVAVAAGGSYWWKNGRERSNAPIAGGGVGDRSIAVLPFTNMSSDKDATYFADGIHEDLLTQLALLGELKVVSRTSVMEYRNTAKNMRQIARELGVATLVEGSVRRAGNQVRVTAQLIDAATDKHLWASNYDRELKDIFAVQSELAGAIASALRVSLTPPEQMRLASKPTENLEAYDLFLRHQEMSNSAVGGLRMVSSAPARVALLMKAVGLDPKFALAWARLATEHARLFGTGFDPSPARKALAERSMERALAVAPQDLQVKIEEGKFQLLARADHARAIQAYTEVLNQAPNNIPSLAGLGEVHTQLGQAAQAVTVLERALAVDARNGGALARLAGIYVRYRHFDRGLALRRQLMEIRPEDIDLQAFYRLFEYWATGRWDAFDAWRATLPKGIEYKSARLRNTDADRAIARRDFAEVRRLSDVKSEDWMVQSPFDQLEKDWMRTLVSYAAGERPKALAEAKVLLPKYERQMSETPEEDSLFHQKARLHAMLGQRDEAMKAHASAVAAAEKRGDQFQNAHARSQVIAVHALLGEREQALDELKKRLRQPGAYIHDLRLDLTLSPLWGVPAFEAIVEDPASNAPLPLTLKL